MRNKTIVKRMRKNNIYIFLLYLLLSLFPLFTLQGMSNMMADNNLQERFAADKLLHENYLDIDFREIDEHGGSVDVITDDYQLVHLCGKKLFMEGNLNKEEYTKIIVEIGNSKKADSDYLCDIAYSKEGSYWVIVSFPNELRILISVVMNPKLEHVDDYIMIVCVLALLYMLIAYFAFFINAKIMARQFTRPLKELCEYTKMLSENQYYDRINTKMEGEFEELKEEFNKLSDRLQYEREKREKLEANKLKILMELSHDLKNPLAAMQGYSEVLLENEDLEEEKKEQYYNVLYQNGVRANQLITDLFAYVKMEGKPLILQKKKMDLCEFVIKQILLYQPEIEKAGMNLEFVLPSEDCMIQCEIDEQQMERVFSNLIENSIKYNIAGTTICIRLEESGDKEKWNLIIGDNGIGIPEQFKETIFEPFVRVDEARNSKTGGTGLGLTIVRHIVEAHGFRIHIAHCSDNKMPIPCGCQFVITMKGEMVSNII